VTPTNANTLLLAQALFEQAAAGQDQARARESLHYYREYIGSVRADPIHRSHAAEVPRRAIPARLSRPGLDGRDHQENGLAMNAANPYVGAYPFLSERHGVWREIVRYVARDAPGAESVIELGAGYLRLHQSVPGPAAAWPSTSIQR